jgi:hypothetical protein
MKPTNINGIGNLSLRTTTHKGSVYLNCKLPLKHSEAEGARLTEIAEVLLNMDSNYGIDVPFYRFSSPIEAPQHDEVALTLSLDKCDNLTAEAALQEILTVKREVDLANEGKRILFHLLRQGGYIPLIDVLREKANMGVKAAVFAELPDEEAPVQVTLTLWGYPKTEIKNDALFARLIAKKVNTTVNNL